MQYLNGRTTGSLLALAIMAGGVNGAFAAGTSSGTPIDNAATVEYQVGGIAQTPLTSNTASFVVDNRVDLTVLESSGTYVSVVPGSTAQVLTFSVTNTGNTPQDYALTAAPGTDPFSGAADDFDAANVAVYVESGANPGYQPAEDIGTFVDELAPDVAATVYVVADIPVIRADGDIAAYTLTATTHDAGTGGLGGLTTATLVADTAAAVDVVLADGAGDTDAASQGDYSATGAYLVASATLNVDKTVQVVSDPFNSTTNPKAIPGATVRYNITVSNSSATTAATDVVVVDAIPANTTYAAGSITLDGAGQTDAADADQADYDATNPGAVTVTIPTVGAGGSATVTFDVTID